MQILSPEGIRRSPHYYPGMKRGNFISIAGIVPVLEDGTTYEPNNAEAQTRFIIDVLEKILAEGNATLKDVVYIHTYYVNDSDMKDIFKVLHERFGERIPPHTGSWENKDSFKDRGICLELEFFAVTED